MSAAPSPQRELHLQGGRPPPLSLSKQSSKIRKQKAAPPPPPPEAKSRRHPPPPVIIYTVSPKKIHVEPEEFMSLVQRLTGSNSSSSTHIDNSPPPPPSSSGGNAGPPEWRETQFFDGGVEMPQNQNLLWNATDDHSNHLVNNLMMNMPSTTNVDAFSYFYHI